MKQAMSSSTVLCAAVCPKRWQTVFLMKWWILHNMPLTSLTRQPIQWLPIKRPIWNIFIRHSIWRHYFPLCLIHQKKWRATAWSVSAWVLPFCHRILIRAAVVLRCRRGIFVLVLRWLKMWAQVWLMLSPLSVRKTACSPAMRILWSEQPIWTWPSVFMNIWLKQVLLIHWEKNVLHCLWHSKGCSRLRQRTKNAMWKGKFHCLVKHWRRRRRRQAAWCASVKNFPWKNSWH